MSNDNPFEPMLDMFIFETKQLLEQLEESIIESEQSGLQSYIDEIFRIMHTIKGSAAMMLFENISSLAHSIEDVFFYLRENQVENVDYSELTDLILTSIDFINEEVSKIEANNESDGKPDSIISLLTNFLLSLKGKNNSEVKISTDNNKEKEALSNQKYYIASTNAANLPHKNNYKITLFFEEDCKMENVRAYTFIFKLKEIGQVIEHYPRDLVDNNESLDIIKTEGFNVIFSTELGLDEIKLLIQQTVFLKNYTIDQVEANNSSCLLPTDSLFKESNDTTENREADITQKKVPTSKKLKDINQSMISVNISKLDILMDLVGELVINQAMVVQHPELSGLNLRGFKNATRQLEKITDEIQDTVMSIRMVPLSITFKKMNRIVRDMSKKLNKKIELELIGQDTEVDKNIIEHISDPLMHLIRNSIDHGIESVEKRGDMGKNETGKITLEAKNEGGDVWIIVKDDGKGLDKNKILSKAKKNNLLFKTEKDMTDKEIYSLVLLPGFSTKENVTEYSGRGVGMDAVVKNIQSIGGSVHLDSVHGIGTTIYIKIPLTLAIINGMKVKVGNTIFTVPITAINQSFKAKEKEIIIDPHGTEMILIRGKCYPVIRLHKQLHINTNVKQIHDGIIIMVENNSNSLCLFADALLGEQQVVIKKLPKYLKSVNGITGCTLLGDGSISLILDISGIIDSITVQKKTDVYLE